MPQEANPLQWHIDYVREAVLAGVSIDLISDKTIELFLRKWIAAIGKEDDLEYNKWLIIYNTSCDCIRWVMTKLTTSGMGTYTSRREKNGTEEIEVKTGDTSPIQHWKALLDYLIKHPEMVDPSLRKAKGNVIIGGVSRDEANRVSRDSNGRNAADMKGLVFGDELSNTTTPRGSIFRDSLSDRYR